MIAQGGGILSPGGGTLPRFPTDTIILTISNSDSKTQVF